MSSRHFNLSLPLPKNSQCHLQGNKINAPDISQSRPGERWNVQSTFVGCHSDSAELLGWSGVWSGVLKHFCPQIIPCAEEKKTSDYCIKPCLKPCCPCQWVGVRSNGGKKERHEAKQLCAHNCARTNWGRIVLALNSRWVSWVVKSSKVGWNPFIFKRKICTVSTANFPPDRRFSFPLFCARSFPSF